jgi:hypothetical protein
MTQVQRAGESLTVDSKVVMWHTVLQIGHDKEPCGVAITNAPLEYDKAKVFAQMVMHKTRSMNCAVQVARYVRRRFEIADATTIHRSTRPIEVKLAYVALNGYQYGPDNVDAEYRQVVAHIADRSIAQLLEESKGGLNAARVRYIVYEVRATCQAEPVRLRAITNKMHAVERLWRQAPPEGFTNIDIVHVGKFETRQLAEAVLGSFGRAGDHLWARFPSVEYLRRILKFDENGDLVFTADSTGAVRPYDTPSVVIGPHVYTESQICHVLEHGTWFDRRTRA